MYIIETCQAATHGITNYALIFCVKYLQLLLSSHHDVAFDMKTQILTVLSLQKLEKPKFVTCIAFAENGDVISGDSNGNIYIWGRGKDNNKPCQWSAL